MIKGLQSLPSAGFFRRSILPTGLFYLKTAAAAISFALR